MEKLQSTSDIVCLFTERSVERPWILFEAGVAKGKMDTPVIGLALGVPLTKISSGPFYQFQNMDDSEADLRKLINQLARRFPGLELDSDVVENRISVFKETEAELLEKMSSGATPDEDAEENSIAKLAEEMKSLPSRIAERLSESGDPYRRKRRRFHPMMFEDMFHISGKSGDPVGILMAASLVRDDMPWRWSLTAQ